jgi:hypothetical protein
MTKAGGVFDMVGTMQDPDWRLSDRSVLKRAVLRGKRSSLSTTILTIFFSLNAVCSVLMLVRTLGCPICETAILRQSTTKAVYFPPREAS